MRLYVDSPWQVRQAGKIRRAAGFCCLRGLAGRSVPVVHHLCFHKDFIKERMQSARLGSDPAVMPDHMRKIASPHLFCRGHPGIAVSSGPALRRTTTHLFPSPTHLFPSPPFYAVSTLFSGVILPSPRSPSSRDDEEWRLRAPGQEGRVLGTDQGRGGRKLVSGEAQQAEADSDAGMLDLLDTSDTLDQDGPAHQAPESCVCGTGADHSSSRPPIMAQLLMPLAGRQER